MARPSMAKSPCAKSDFFERLRRSGCMVTEIPAYSAILRLHGKPGKIFVVKDDAGHVVLHHFDADNQHVAIVGTRHGDLLNYVM